ncbi:MAG: 50S ribosomal protein L25/general stress protein Ctc [Gammaproteobacteria bacterium]|jgi:large subunit ribosomal protein L25|nr:MAG: 50S ribosomal protein L25/general stress protein Ctc [Gammaproteobacteria bacterium]
MSQKIEINAEVRADVGKGASRRLRRSGNSVPGIIYGAEEDPVNLTLNTNELSKAMQSEAFFSQILDVKFDGKSQQAVLRDLQRNPATEKVLHVDFMRISANKPIQVSVPLHFVNEDKCKGVRLGGGTISHTMNEVEISCLPADLPEFIEVYMAELDVGEIIHLSDLALPAGVSIVALAHDDDRAVASVLMPRGGADEEEEAMEAAAEGEEAAAEGEEAPAGDAEEESSED